VERVFYCAGCSFVTGGDIAQALLEYSRWLVARGEVDVVHVPTRGDDGSVGRTAVLLTSATQMSAESLPADGAELHDPELVERLRISAARLRPRAAVPEDGSPDGASHGFDF
jgi:hypothetical protein